MNNTNKKNKYRDYAFLVLSCDKYSDLWEQFFIQFRKYWPDCPFKVFLGSNRKKYQDHSIPSLLSMTSTDWSSDFLSILTSMKEKYIFVWMDDFFLIDNINTELFLRCFQYMEITHANHIHYTTDIPPDGYCSDRLFGFYEKKAPYRVSVTGFWNKLHLQKLLVPGENPWKFEIMGSYRSSYSDGYYCINKPLARCINIVEKGGINRDVYRYCNKNNITLDTSRRDVYSEYETIKNRMQVYLFHTVLKIPWQIRLGLMEILRKIIISY